MWVVVGDWLTCGGVDQCGDIRKPDFEEIAEFGDGADGGARGFNRVGLLNRDRRANVLDRIDFRAIHQLHELARVGGECLDVASLAFGVQRLKHERGFARATKPGDDGKLANGQVEIETFKVILADAAKVDVFFGGHRV